MAGASKSRRETHCLKESQNVMLSDELVLESNLELYEDQGVKTVDKENLHTGECGGLTDGNVDMETTDLYIDKDEELLECCGLSMEKGGAASKGVAAVLRDLKYRHRLDVVVILEPRVSGKSVDKIIKGWGFNHSVRKEAEGFSGGIWILWNLNELRIDVRVLDEQFIHCHLSLHGKKMLFTAVYASPNVSKRDRIWDMLQSLAGEINEPWLLVGDFNEIKTPLEQKGGGSWQEEFLNAVIKVISRVCSDHHPLVVNLNVENKEFKARNFRFEAVWQMHGQFEDLVKRHWTRDEELNMKLSSLQQKLMCWNKDFLVELRVERGGF
ncbi:hypothetical protein K1719_030765 [Acacia pycnantha]|nr:hypothetical protein K1719_030765 [Acacia pycnantha]